MKKPTILIVEDDADIRGLLARIFKSEGFEALLAANGREALDQLSQRLPDLILLDYKMPGMSGLEFRKEHEMHPQFSKVPVVLMSAERDLESLGMKIGLNRYVRKPLEIDQLLEVVSSAFKLAP